MRSADLETGVSSNRGEYAKYGLGVGDGSDLLLELGLLALAIGLEGGLLRLQQLILGHQRPQLLHQMRVLRNSRHRLAIEAEEEEEEEGREDNSTEAKSDGDENENV
jgi:hypothetical protein